jgi:hypothetical protein
MILGAALNLRFLNELAATVAGNFKIRRTSINLADASELLLSAWNLFISGEF